MTYLVTLGQSETSLPGPTYEPHHRVESVLNPESRGLRGDSDRGSYGTQVLQPYTPYSTGSFYHSWYMHGTRFVTH
jgi:hypothetical protein